MRFLNNLKNPPIIMSIGGSLIVPNGGIDTHFLKKLNTFIRKHTARGKRFFLVAGGGKTARHYAQAGEEVIGNVTNEDLDWLGIHSTRLNAHLLRTIFKDIAHPRIIENYDRKVTDFKKPVIIGAGWKPGWSTDYNAVKIADDYNGKLVINLTNIDYVYTKDPKKYKTAEKIEKLTWEEMEKLVGTEWQPGINAPFDPLATQYAKKLNLTVIITNGHNFNNLDKILSGEKFKGTVVVPFDINPGFYDKEYYFGKKGEYKRYLTPVLRRLLTSVVETYRAWLIKLFLKPKKLLDVGCGTGTLVKKLRRLGVDAYGLEISDYALQSADDDIKPFLIKGSINKLPFEDNSFDTVISFDVLEHIERTNIKSAVKETIRVASKNILHKIYTTDNLWITLFHGYDPSHLSIMSAKDWRNLFRQFDNVILTKKGFFKLPSIFESIFLLKKKQSL